MITYEGHKVHIIYVNIEIYNTYISTFFINTFYMCVIDYK